jgi:hypothetical protein
MAARRQKSGEAVVARRQRRPEARMAGAAQRARRGNPQDAAAAASEGFHGRPETEIIEVREPVHFHRDLADCGELIELCVLDPDGQTVRLHGFDGSRLAFNEQRNQLFIRGGDQFVDVDLFGLDEDRHEAETLGHVVRVVYHSTKEHLGNEGGDADYFHDFGEETLKKMGIKRPASQDLRAVCPELVYRHRNPSLEFVGGRYTVEDEGIRN